MSKISIFALLGLVVIGFSNPAPVIPLSFILIWLIAVVIRGRGRGFRLPAGIEAVVVFMGFLISISIETTYEVHLFVRLGNGLAVIQLLRMFRNLKRQEKIASIVISFTHLAVSTQVIVGPVFILTLLCFACLFPATLRELSGKEKVGSRKLTRDCLTLVASSCLFFFIFPRIFIPQQQHLRIPAALSIPVPDSPATEADPLIMLVEGEELGRLRLFIACSYDRGRWKRKPKYGEEIPVPALPDLRQNRLLGRRLVIMDVAQAGGFLPHDGKIVSARGNYFRESFLTTVGDYRIAQARLTGPGRINFYILAEAPKVSLSSDELVHYTSLPVLSPKAAQLVSEVTEGIKCHKEKAYKLSFFLTSSFEYIRVPPKRDMSFGEFLWVHKKGNCVDFAGALAMMARISGIPSRVVAGFIPRKIGEGRRHKIRQSDGHAWTEIYLEGRGWVSFDATPPCREPMPFYYALLRPIERLRDIWYWNIVAFSFPEQEIILRRTSLFLRRHSLFPLGVLVLGGLLFLLKRKLHLFRIFKRKGPRGSMKIVSAKSMSRINFYIYMNKLLSRLGYSRLPNETPLEFAWRLKEKGFPLAGEIKLLSRYFCKVRYGGEVLTSHMQKETKNSLLRLKSNLSPVNLS